MKKKQLFISINNEDYEVRNETHQGKDYLVVPVIMMVPGVHNGSRGALFHSADELSKLPQAWNGVPITINHPKKENDFVSANNPEIVEEYKVGIIYNAYYDNGLKAEAWLEIDELKEKSPQVYNDIIKKKVIEVSIGMFSDEIEEDGEFEGEIYEKIAMNHRPDHLALLPGGVGACSVTDGCGVRNNNSNNKRGGTVYEKNLINQVRTLKKSGYSIDKPLNNLSDGLMERLDMLHGIVNSMDKNGRYYYLQEAYDNYFIYKVVRDGDSPELYRQNYSVSNNEIELNGDPQEVRKKVEYITALENDLGNDDSEEHTVTYRRRRRKKSKTNVNMSTKKCESCIKKIDALIANKAYKEDDREWLSALEEEQLDSIVAASEKKEEKKKPNVNEKNEFQALSAEDKAALAFGKKQLKARRNNFIEGIQANTEENLWPLETLNKMEDDDLERLYKSVKSNKEEEEIVDYSLSYGASGEYQTNNSDHEPLGPSGVELED